MNDNSHGNLREPTLSRRELFGWGGRLAVGLVALGAASELPLAYASYTNVITCPKLSESPLSSDLVTKFDLWKEFTFVDLLPKENIPSNKGAYGKLGAAFDDANIDFIFDFVSEAVVGPWAVVNLAIERQHANAFEPLSTTFLAIYQFDTASPPTGQTASIQLGTGFGWSDSQQPLPNGFTWSATSEQSPFNQNAPHPVFGVRIPNSYMGAGRISDGTYGIFAEIYTESKNQEVLRSVVLPTTYWDQPNTYDTLATQFPIPEPLDALTYAVPFMALPAIRILRYSNQTKISRRDFLGAAAGKPPEKSI
jgi:hypothetical protein